MEANSRLDRLFLLLSSGSNSSTRTTAASQLGQIAGSSPDSLRYLLSRLIPIFRSHQWEARISAGLALEAILKNSPQEEEEEEMKDEKLITDTEKFFELNLEFILKNQSYLVSKNQEEEVDEQEEESPGEQRNKLDNALGLKSTFIKSEDLYSNEDLKISKPKKRRNRSNGNVSATEAKRSKIPTDLPQMDLSDTTTSPITSFFNLMYEDLFNSSWEIRHGSATALRDIVRLRGYIKGQSKRAWLRKLSKRLSSMIALDRFGDFVSDQVVAPVRESGAQALGYVMKRMEDEDLKKILLFLLELLNHQDWQCRHGGLLGMKYFLAARSDTENLLQNLIDPIFKGLEDSMDDVVSVAASALLPVAEKLPNTLNQVQIDRLTNRLWDSLLDIDDLTTSTQSLMTLLSRLLRSVGSSSVDLASKVPRIFPLLSHSSKTVRRSALEALFTLTSTRELSPNFLPQNVHGLTSVLFQRALKEFDENNLSLIERVWKNVCDFTPLGPLLLATCPLYGVWLSVVSQPPNCLLSFNDSSEQFYLGGSDVHSVIDSDEKSAYIMRARLLACRLLGYLAGFVVKPVPDMLYTSDNDPLDTFVSKILFPYLYNSRSAYNRTSVFLVIVFWNSFHSSKHSGLSKALVEFLSETPSYDETLLAFSTIQTDASDLLASLRHYKLGQSLSSIQSPSLTYEDIRAIADIPDTDIQQNNKIRPKLKSAFIERKQNLALGLETIKKEQSFLSVMVSGSLASSAVSCKALPEKLNPIIKPLMESIKRESNLQLQNLCAEHLANVMELCVTSNPSSNDKIVKNLVNFVSSDPEVTPDESSDDQLIISLNKLSVIKTKELSKFILQRRGSSLALKAIVSRFSNNLKTSLPKLWEQTAGIVNKIASIPTKESINGLQALEIMIPALPTDVFAEDLESIAQYCIKTHLQNSLSSIRHMSARCVSEISAILPKAVMSLVLNHVIGMFEVSDLNSRCGAIEVTSTILDKMGTLVVPYIVLFVVPVLGRMSDSNENIRNLASRCFAALVRLMPLDSGEDSDSNLFTEELRRKKAEENSFIRQLMNSQNAEEFVLPVTLKSGASLRSYQKAGVNWMIFLNKYKLHGILCDDMGLGKTLQSISVLASDQYLRKVQGLENLPSLVICPPTLGGHWKSEISKFIDSEHLNPILYAGNASGRMEARNSILKYNIIISSYDIVRNDIDFFKRMKWNYLILDEGHIIKNAKTKTTCAIKQLISNHRIILSGTPIQNSVLELWSLFDFLMPGYLGSEREFSSKFSKPILLSREPKCSKKDQESGALATEALHRQILPFVLRRMKEDVLEDLPPKITQDYYCDLSPFQVQLYEEFTSKMEDPDCSNKNDTKSHVFKALQYLRKVCNHPKLVTDCPSQDISLSSKLPALRELLLTCGIGTDSGTQDVISQHRALIFFQLKSMMDIVENDLLKALMPSVAYLRLDGSVPASKRHDIVSKFNSDASIDVLLLSTAVGGLGLNLTGADTVIFAEHDWNPMKDLQAMDRAHRIGQKKVVNVYRLITRNTIEEKILGLQKFKIKTANTVISSDNSSMDYMATGQLFDLFSLDESEGSSKKPKSSGGSIKTILENLPELWDDKEYAQEYDIQAFIDKNSE